MAFQEEDAAIFYGRERQTDASGGARLFQVVISPSGGGVTLRDEGPLEVVVPGTDRDSGASVMAWSRSGRWLAIKTTAGVDVLDPVTRKRITQVPLSERDPARLLASSPDDRWLFVCAANDTVTAIDAKSWRARPPITLTSPLASLAFGPDGMHFATFTKSRSYHRSQPIGAQTHIWSLAGDDAPTVMNPAPGAAGEGLGDASSWPGRAVHDAGLTSMNGQWQFTASTDGDRRTPSVIHSETQEAIHLEADVWDPNAVPKPWTITAAFSPDSRWLATAESAEDGTRAGMLRVWPLRAADLIAEACARVGRNLKPSEWKGYPDKPFPRTCENLPAGTD